MTPAQFFDRKYSIIVNKAVRLELSVGEHITHDARHTFISRADDSGINENALKKIVGHSLSGVTGKSYIFLDRKNKSEKTSVIIAKILHWDGLK